MAEAHIGAPSRISCSFASTLGGLVFPGFSKSAGVFDRFAVIANQRLRSPS